MAASCRAPRRARWKPDETSGPAPTPRLSGPLSACLLPVISHLLPAFLPAGTTKLSASVSLLRRSRPGTCPRSRLLLRSPRTRHRLSPGRKRPPCYFLRRSRLAGGPGPRPTGGGSAGAGKGLGCARRRCCGQGAPAGGGCWGCGETALEAGLGSAWALGCLPEPSDGGGGAALEREAAEPA